MAAAPGRMIHAGMQGIATGEGSLTAVGTEIAIMTTIVTVTEMIPDLNRDLMRDRSAAGRPAAVKSRTIDRQGRKQKQCQGIPVEGVP